MEVSEMTSNEDLELGGGGDEGSACFSDEGSCSSRFYSTADGDDYSSSSLPSGSDQIPENENLECSRRASSSSMADPYPCDLESGLAGIHERTPAPMGFSDMDCRICHLSLVNSSPVPGSESGSNIPIELGCSCKDDLAAAHKHCAETWFKIKGDKTCEICNSIARNVVGPNYAAEAAQQEMIEESGGGVVALVETRSCINGHRVLNFLLACMVFAFVVSWLFRFSIPS